MPPSYLRYYHQPGKRARYPWFSRLLIRFGAPLLTLYMFGAAFFMYKIESLPDEGFAYAMKLMWLPIVSLVAAITWFCRGEFAKVTKSLVKLWMQAALACPIILFSSWPYVMLWNALGSSHSGVIYEGPVIEKSARKGRYKVTISDHFTQEPITLRIDKRRYETLSKDDFLRETFYVGRLGLRYRWISGGKE